MYELLCIRCSSGFSAIALCTALLPLPNKEPKTEVVRLKCDLRTLGEVEHIALGRVHLLARLVRNIKAAVDNDLHLVVGVLVDKGSTCRKEWSGQSHLSCLRVNCG